LLPMAEKSPRATPKKPKLQDGYSTNQFSNGLLVPHFL
jgi:hypothetical protein